MELNNTFPWIDDHATVAQIPSRSFIHNALSHGLNHTAYKSFDTDAKATTITEKLGWELEHSYTTDGTWDILSYNTNSTAGNPLIIVTQYERRIGVWTAATTTEEAQKALHIFGELCDPIQLDKPGVVPIKFWVLGQQGPQSVLRDIDIIPWDRIYRNYSSDACDGITAITGFRPPIDNGNLILWHGPPGTGKTHAIRSLVDAWLPWCDVHYVMDPEDFFGHPFYMSHVLLDEKSTYVYPKALTEDGFVLNGHDRWKLLIIEDADELINDDARHRSGQNLSRLLNLGDGLVGQGLRTLTLITTNEPIDHIHPAVGRRGRCAAKIHFDSLDHRQATEWLHEQGIDARVPGPMTLADLYELKRAHQQIDVPQGEFRSGIYI